MNNNIDIKIVMLQHAVSIPKYAKSGDAGCDLICAIDENSPYVVLAPGERKLLPTGICISLPEGYEASVRPRSGLSSKKGLSVIYGTVDSGYIGEIMVLVHNVDKENNVLIKRGDKIAQMVILPVMRATFIEVDMLEPTERGSDGFGSTGY